MRAAGIEPDPWQRSFLQSTAKRRLLLCSRQSGKSTTTASLVTHHANQRKDALVLLISPGLRQSGEIFKKVTWFYQQLDDGVRVPVVQASALQMTLANGSRIISLPGKEETIRGYSGVTLAVFDEAARTSDALYYSIRPMLATSDGDLVGLTTPWGKRGWFYDEWHSDRDWERTRITAHDCPRIPEEFLKEEFEAMGEWWYSQEYMCEFRDTIDQVFDSEAINSAFVDGNPLFGTPDEQVDATLTLDAEPLFGDDE